MKKKNYKNKELQSLEEKQNQMDHTQREREREREEKREKKLEE